MTIYQSEFIVEVPIQYAFEYLSQPHNLFDIMNNSWYTYQFEGEEPTKDQKVQVGDCFKVLVVDKKIYMYCDLILTKIAQNSKIEYKYDYKAIKMRQKHIGSKLLESSILRSQNKIDNHDTWTFRAKDKQNVVITYTSELRGTVSFLKRIELYGVKLLLKIITKKALKRISSDMRDNFELNNTKK